MKILVVSQRFWPDQFRINEIVTELVKKGHQVSVICGRPQDEKGRILKAYQWGNNRRQSFNGASVYRMYESSRKKNIYSLFLSYLSFMISSSIFALFDRRKYDRIFVFQLSPITQIFPAIIIKKKIKIPLVTYIQDLWPMSVTVSGIKTSSLVYKYLLKFCSYLYNQAEKILVTSQSFENILFNDLKFKGECTYLPQFSDVCIKQEDTLEKGKGFNVVFAGNIGITQSINTVLQAAEILKENLDIRFWIVGSGRKFNEMVSLIAEKKLTNIIVTGQQPLHKMPYYHSLADLFLVTMVLNPLVNNTLPAKVQTYMAYGKPIVSSAGFETKRIIEEANCGKCVEPEDAVGLAKLIEFYYSNPKEVIQHGENGRNYFSIHFSKDRFYDAINEVMDIKL